MSLPVYWGFSATTTPTAAQIQALDLSKNSGPYFDSYPFPGPASGRYAVIAFPQIAGVNAVFFESSAAVSFSNSTVAVTVDGNAVNYTVFVSATLIYEDRDLVLAARGTLNSSAGVVIPDGGITRGQAIDLPNLSVFL